MANEVITKAVALLREALMSEHLTPYAESRIRAAILALGKPPWSEVRNVSEFEGAVMVALDGAVYRIINGRWEKVSDAPTKP